MQDKNNEQNEKKITETKKKKEGIKFCCYFSFVYLFIYLSIYSFYLFCFYDSFSRK